MKNQVDEQYIILGNLDLQVAFRFPGSKTIYRTITHPPRAANPAYGKRDCLNLTTNKAESLGCNKPVFPVERK